MSLLIIPSQVFLRSKKHFVERCENYGCNSDTNTLSSADLAVVTLPTLISSQITESSSIKNPNPHSHPHPHPKYRKTGRAANVNWRAVPIDDLRLHPLFQALPLHPSIPLSDEEMNNPENFSYVMQSQY